MPVLLTIKEASDYSGLSENRIRQAIENGEMRAFMLPHGQKMAYKTTTQEIDQWIDKEMTYVHFEAVQDMEKQRNRREPKREAERKPIGSRLVPGTSRLEIIYAGEENVA